MSFVKMFIAFSCVWNHEWKRSSNNDVVLVKAAENEAIGPYFPSLRILSKVIARIY